MLSRNDEKKTMMTDLSSKCGRILLLWILMAALAGCDGFAKSFVKDAVPYKEPPEVIVGDDPFESGKALRVSPGRVFSTATGMSLHGTVLPVNRRLSGGGISAEVSLSRHRQNN